MGIIIVAGLGYVVFAVWIFPSSDPMVRDNSERPAVTWLTENTNTLPAAKPPKLLHTPNVNEVLAKSFLVIDEQSGETLVEHQSAQPLAVASLTKLMTAYVVIEHGDLDDTVSGQHIELPNPVLRLSADDSATVEDLLMSMLVGSANDVAVLMSQYISNTTQKNFTVLMNQAAATLHMEDTHFSNALGFDSDRNYSTAQDLVKLIRALETYPVLERTGNTTHYSFKTTKGTTMSIESTNKLSGHPDIEVVKTGFTETAGGALISKATMPGGRKVLIIVISSPDRERDTLGLKTAVQEAYAWQ